MRKFMYIECHIVGNPVKWNMAYSSDLKKYDSIDGAILHGKNVLQHDDFLVAEWNGRQIVQVYGTTDGTHEPRNEPSELVEMNEEFAFPVPRGARKLVANQATKDGKP